MQFRILIEIGIGVHNLTCSSLRNLYMHGMSLTVDCILLYIFTILQLIEY